MKIVNLTPHPVVIFFGDGEKMVVEPTAPSARCFTARERIGEIKTDGGISIPVFQTRLGTVENLPPYNPDVALIVSRVVAEAARERGDLFIPDDVMRDENGNVIGCRALARP